MSPCAALSDNVSTGRLLSQQVTYNDRKLRGSDYLSHKVRTMYISWAQANMDVKKKKFLHLGHLEKLEVDLTSGNYVSYELLKIRVKSIVYSRFVISLSLNHSNSKIIVLFIYIKTLSKEVMALVDIPKAHFVMCCQWQYYNMTCEFHNGNIHVISSVGFPGFNIGMITAFVQSAGRLTLLVWNLLYIMSSVSIALGLRFLMNFGNILSGYGCFLLLMSFIASFNSVVWR